MDPAVLSHQFVGHSIKGDLALDRRPDEQLMVGRDIRGSKQLLSQRHVRKAHLIAAVRETAVPRELRTKVETGSPGCRERMPWEVAPAA